MTVSGSRLDLVQKPRFYVQRLSSHARTKRDTANTEADTVYADCSSMKASEMICKVPAIPNSWLENLPSLSDLDIDYGVIMDGIQVCLLTLVSFLMSLHFLHESYFTAEYPKPDEQSSCAIPHRT